MKKRSTAPDAGPRGLLAGTLLVALCTGCHDSGHAGPGLPTRFAGAVSGAGNADGPAATARFNAPSAVAVDAQGNVFVADASNNTIREISAVGVVTTLAGTPGVAGSADGIGAAASFNNPFGLALDGAGSLYVADTNSNLIRKLTLASGQVATVAGLAGIAGAADGPGHAATFNNPNGLALDGDHLFIADSNNQVIRVLTLATGVVSTLAGKAGVAGMDNGPAAQATFNCPYGLALDAAKNLYVADSYNNAIRKISPAGEVGTLTGGGPSLSGNVDGGLADALFNNPGGLQADSAGNLYVADAYNQVIREITAAGKVSRLAGNGTPGWADGPGAEAQFNLPVAVAIGPTGLVYVADLGNNSVRKVSQGVVSRLAGTPTYLGSEDGQGGVARFNTPMGLTVNSAGTVFVADEYNSLIRRITADGTVTTLAGVLGGGDADGAAARASFQHPYAVALAGDGTLYVADFKAHTIRSISPGGQVATLAGSPGQPGSAEGTGPNARFNGPIGLALDGAGHLLVADSNNATIRTITLSDGAVTTLAGAAGQAAYVDGQASEARFTYPNGLAVDATGRIYLTDNNTIRTIVNGRVTTLAGRNGVNGAANGLGTLATFSNPSSLALDGAWNLIVADTSNNAIRRVTPQGEVSTITTVALPTGSAALPLVPMNPTGVAVDPVTGDLLMTVANAVLRYRR